MQTNDHSNVKFGLALLVFMGIAALFWSPIIITYAENNMVSVRALQSLSADTHSYSPLSFCHQEHSITFPEMVYYLRQIDRSIDNKEMGCLQQTIAHFSKGRREILLLLEADLYWKQGLHEQACKQLQELGVTQKMIQLAQRSATLDDYEAVAIYLNCVDWSQIGSSHPAAMLYRRLGIYYRQQGLNADAFKAYEQAGKLYPGVWAEPYIMQSDFLWQNGQQERALQLLEGALSRSKNATATFQLARALGLRLEEIGRLRSAYCAMQQALRVEDQVPLANASEGWRLDLRKRTKRLESMLSSDAESRRGLCDDQ